MKITQETNEFKPITIVLEHKHEAIELLRDMEGKPSGAIDELYFFLYEALKVKTNES